MIAQPQYPERMTPEEYLEWEATQECRHEYIDGEIIAMTGGSLPHNDITLNFYRTLYSHLRPRGCRVNVSDAKVQANNSRYFYPDLVISCDFRDRESRNFIQHPQVIIEVLSPSTGNYDRTKKLQYYRQIASLQEPNRSVLRFIAAVKIKFGFTALIVKGKKLFYLVSIFTVRSS